MSNYNVNGSLVKMESLELSSTVAHEAIIQLKRLSQ